MSVREWSSITGRGGVLNGIQKKGGGRKFFSHPEGGHNKFCGSFNTGA